MKRFVSIVVLSTSLAAVPAMADHSKPLDVGGVIGAAVGGYLGSKVGDGTGRAAATAAGAVGGYLIGENLSHRQGGYGRAAASHGSDYGKRQPQRKAHGYHEARLHPIHETYVATCTSNVRAGPGTGYAVVDQLHRYERVRVVGKVKGRNWYMVKTHGGRGFVYAPLLEPSDGYASSDYGYRGHSSGYHGGGYRPGSDR